MKWLPCCLCVLVVPCLVPDPTGSAQSVPATAVDPAAPRERHALQVFLGIVQRTVESAAEAMPADKYDFVPTEGEFRGVRSFRRQVKHLAATNYILAAAALGQDPPAAAGDEVGPDSVAAKEDVLRYLHGSFVALGNAVAAIGGQPATVRSSPISPLQGASATRPALVVEALIHAFDHYGQMVVYLRLNGVVPPASRS